MKRIIIGLCMAFAFATAFAQEHSAENAVQQVKPPSEKAPWPVWVTFNNTRDVDVIGLRLTLPYGSCESVTGFDVGFFGRCRYFEGFQMNILRNDVTDVMVGAQGGIYNSAGRADFIGVQLGCWNESRSIRGAQVGLVNVADFSTGVQIGIINRTEAMYGFQLGLVNVIRESELSFCPILNVGFDTISEF